MVLQDRRNGAVWMTFRIFEPGGGGDKKSPQPDQSLSERKKASLFVVSPPRSTAKPKPIGKRKKVTLPAIIVEDQKLGGEDVLLVTNKTVTVAEGAQLTLAPGTWLAFGPKAALVVEGALVAAGTNEAPIFFTSASGRQRWQGLYLKLRRKGAPANKLSWCVVKRAEYGLHLSNSGVVVEHCAFIRNQVGMLFHHDKVSITDTVIAGSVGDGVSAGEDFYSTWTDVTISGSGGIGYHGTFKGWARMDRCAITGNAGGGLKGERRGRPEVNNSNIHSNTTFDIWCAQKESYEFKNVHVGAKSSKLLASKPNTTVPNIIDARRTGKTGMGIVVIKGVSVTPISPCGASEKVRTMAQQYDRLGIK